MALVARSRCSVKCSAYHSGTHNYRCWSQSRYRSGCRPVWTNHYSINSSSLLNGSFFFIGTRILQEFYVNRYRNATLFEISLHKIVCVSTDLWKWHVERDGCIQDNLQKIRGNIDYIPSYPCRVTDHTVQEIVQGGDIPGADHTPSLALPLVFPVWPSKTRGPSWQGGGGTGQVANGPIIAPSTLIPIIRGQNTDTSQNKERLGKEIIE